jgi:hypothetical protein
MNRLAAASVMVLVAFVAMVQAQAPKADPNGTWKWKEKRGQNEVDATMKLKVEGDKVSGTVSMPGFGKDAQAQETPISAGKYKDGELAFSLTRETKKGKFTTKYTGKVSGDSIKGKMEREGQDKATTSDWEAKREPAKKG